MKVTIKYKGGRPPKDHTDVVKIDEALAKFWDANKMDTKDKDAEWLAGWAPVQHRKEVAERFFSIARRLEKASAPAKMSAQDRKDLKAKAWDEGYSRSEFDEAARTEGGKGIGRNPYRLAVSARKEGKS